MRRERGFESKGWRIGDKVKIISTDRYKDRIFEVIGIDNIKEKKGDRTVLLLNEEYSKGSIEDSSTVKKFDYLITNYNCWGFRGEIEVELVKKYGVD